MCNTHYKTKLPFPINVKDAAYNDEIMAFSFTKSKKKFTPLDNYVYLTGAAISEIIPVLCKSLLKNQKLPPKTNKNLS